jgi:hypothetical protein
VLRQILGNLPASAWEIPTPADGWAIRDQVSHIAYFDDTTSLSMTNPEQFAIEANRLMASNADFADEVAKEFRDLSASELLGWFDRARDELIHNYGISEPRRRVPWYGVEMSVMSSATARLMETWAHGVDITEALGVPIVATARLRHIAHIGVSTMGFSFVHHSLEVPTEPVRIELEAPDGTCWSYGPENAPDLVIGSALDFCLLVTQRRHLTDTSLKVTGATATAWARIAQAFAGPPSEGRPPQGRES